METVPRSSLGPLRNYWHPVALSSHVTDKPVARVLLNEEIVIWRSGESFVAFADLCIHRGTKLSLGWVENCQIICPYHGWAYDEAGICTRIPSLHKERSIPVKARAQKYHCQEKYGLVFVCLGEPKAPIVGFPEYGKEGFRIHFVGPVSFKASATRSFENFMDDTHFPWVHPGILGNASNVDPTPRRSISESDGQFFFETEIKIGNRFDVNDRSTTTTRVGYRIVPPLALYQCETAPDGSIYSKVFFSSPESDRTCVRYLVAAMNGNLDRSAEPMISSTLKVWEQDRPIVESQRPEKIPLDLKQELHLRDPDGPSVVYRRMLSELGIDEFA